MCFVIWRAAQIVGFVFTLEKISLPACETWALINITHGLYCASILHKNIELG